MTGFFGKLFGKSTSGATLDMSEPAALESIIRDGPADGEHDQRHVVADVSVSPWRAFCCLKLKYSNGTEGVGTGILIRPDVILTAAHNLYALDLGTFIKSGSAHAGMKNGVWAAETRLKRIEVCPGYTDLSPNDPKRYQYDFGVARLESDALYRWANEALDVTAQEPIPDPEIRNSRLNVAGYPDKEGPLTLKTDSGAILADTLGRSNFRYRMDTMPGQSGGPVFRYHEDSKSMLYAGVHVAGDVASNMARRFDATMKSQVKTWLKEFGV